MRKAVFAALFCLFAFSSCNCAKEDAGAFSGLVRCRAGGAVAAAFSPGGDTLAVACGDGSIIFLDVGSGKDAVSGAKAPVSDEPLAGIAYSDSGEDYFVADSLRLFRVRASDNTITDRRDFVEGRPDANSTGAFFAPSAALAYFDPEHDRSSGRDLDGDTPAVKFVSDEITSFAFARAGAIYYFALSSGEVAVVTPEGDERVPVYEGGTVYVAVPHDGSYVATGSPDWDVAVWEPGMSAKKRTFTAGGVVSAIAAAPGLVVVAVAESKRVLAFDLSAGVLIWSEFTEGVPGHLSVSRDGNTIACVVDGGADGAFVEVFSRR